jgi:hypothetical protein
MIKNSYLMDDDLCFEAQTQKKARH